MKYLLILLLVCSCARAPLKNREDSMRPSSFPALQDALTKESFFVALRKHLDVMKTSRLVKDPMVFGKKTISKEAYIRSLESIFANEANWLVWIENHFDAYEVYGKDEWGEVLATGYYEPKVPGSMIRTEEFSQPLYSAPLDLVTLDLRKFAHKFSHDERLGQLQGRVEEQRFVPYYDRKTIDVDMKLQGRGLEVAWVRPIDAFFIQIQGSGVVEFSDGAHMRVGYDGQNGHSYVAIGKFLTDHIPLNEMSMQKIKAHLLTLNKMDQQNILNKNPSYVFFKKLESDALTYAGMEVSPGRTIATDLHLFPKGAMAFLEIEEPVFDSPEAIVPANWVKVPRLVFDQDTGGAIKGGGRVDLYFGQGDIASQKAGVMKQKAKLFYLVPKLP